MWISSGSTTSDALATWPGPAEVLLVPEHVVVEEELAREPVRQRAVREDEQLPVAVQLLGAAHRLSELESVRAALRELK